MFKLVGSGFLSDVQPDRPLPAGSDADRCGRAGGAGGKGDGWLELLGCGMIHPNVLKNAGIDPEKYKGFAWGGGIDRLVMMKYMLNDVRYFESGKLDFLEEF